MKIQKNLKPLWLLIAGACLAQSMALAQFTHPVSGTVPNGGHFGACRDGCSRTHAGLDISGSTGTLIGAGYGGTVSFAGVSCGLSCGYGRVVYIDHASGYQTRYAHNDSLLVSVGNSVTQNQNIARRGNTGGSTGPHVHYEIRRNGTALYIPGSPGTSITRNTAVPENYPGLDAGGGNPQSKPGWYRVSDASWHLRNSLSGGASDITFVYGPAGSNVVPVTGDWNGDGEATAGWYRHSDASWHLKNSNSGGSSDYAFVFGVAGNNTIVPVTGDWNGDGKTTVGWFRPSDSSWHLRNSLSGGASHYAFVNGAAGAMPVTGDWNGNGKTTVGWYRRSDASWHLRNSLSGGASDYTFVYGVAGNNTLIPVTGDWNANGKTTIGWYRPADASWHLRNSLSGGTTDYAFVYGATNAIPVAWAE